MENSGFEKAWILLDCLLPVCQGLKIGIKRHPLFVTKGSSRWIEYLHI